MERKEQLCRAIKKIGWGYVFLYFNINLGTINIMPAWIGYILFYQAIRDGISQEEESAGLLKTIGIILGIYNFSQLGCSWYTDSEGINSSANRIIRSQTKEVADLLGMVYRGCFRSSFSLYLSLLSCSLALSFIPFQGCCSR